MFTQKNSYQPLEMDEAADAPLQRKAARKQAQPQGILRRQESLLLPKRGPKPFGYNSITGGLRKTHPRRKRPVEESADQRDHKKHKKELAPELKPVPPVPARRQLPPLPPLPALPPPPSLPPPKRIQETLSEKVSKLLQRQQQAASPSSASSSQESKAGSNTAGATPPVASNTDYSQGILLRRINQYLESLKKDKISEEGYCHGIVLLWLTMMSWGVERLFYDMIKVIAECPPDQLFKIGDTITGFLELIEVGQNPGKFSNNQCTQKNVDEIIGAVVNLFDVTATYSKEALEKELKNLAKDNNMIAVTGWWEAKTTVTQGTVTTTQTKEKGHTVGVYIRESQHHFFDPNFKELGDLKYSEEPVLVTEIWKKVFEAFGNKMEQGGKMTLAAVRRQDPPKLGPPPGLSPPLATSAPPSRLITLFPPPATVPRRPVIDQPPLPPVTRSLGPPPGFKPLAPGEPSPAEQWLTFDCSRFHTQQLQQSAQSFFRFPSGLEPEQGAVLASQAAQPH